MCLNKENKEEMLKQRLYKAKESAKIIESFLHYYSNHKIYGCKQKLALIR